MLESWKRRRQEKIPKKGGLPALFPGKTVPVYRNRNNHGGAVRVHPRFKKFFPGLHGAFGDCKKHTLFYKSDGNQLDERYHWGMPAIWAGGRRSVSRHTSRASLGDPPRRSCKGFKGGKHDSPLCVLFASFLWRQRKEVPPLQERFREKMDP